MKREPLLIFPCNGNGIEALDCLDESRFEFIGFIDDNPEKQGKQGKWPVYGRSILEEMPEARVLAVPGSPLSFRNRSAHIDSLGIARERFVSIIHPGAHVGRDVQLGVNCLLMAGVVLTSNVRVGDHVCILPNTVIHHDSVVGDLTLIGCNVAIAGGTSIGRNCYIGSGSNFINGIQIGDRTLVGLGSNVLRDVPPDALIAGNPAKPLQSKSNP